MERLLGGGGPGNLTPLSPGRFRMQWLDFFRLLLLLFSKTWIKTQGCANHTLLHTTLHHWPVPGHLSHCSLHPNPHTYSPRPALPGTLPVVDRGPYMCSSLRKICNVVCVFIYINSIVL